MARRYPVIGGRIQAPRLELGIAEHCNLSCRSCSHLSPVMPRHNVDPAALAGELATLGAHYHVRLVRLLGGEPLLHPRLLDVIQTVRESGIGDAISVVTNGVRLPRMTGDFWRAVDRVEVSLYPGKELTPEQREQCSRRALRHGTELAFRRTTEFRQAYSEVGTTSRALSQAIFESCLIVHQWRCHTLARGRFYKCPQSYYLQRILGSPSESADSLLVEDRDDFGRELRGYLEAAHPLQACGHCLGTAGKRFPHTQVPRSEFRELQRLPAEDLIDRGLVGIPAAPRPRRLALRGLATGRRVASEARAGSA